MSKVDVVPAASSLTEAPQPVQAIISEDDGTSVTQPDEWLSGGALTMGFCALMLGLPGLLGTLAGFSGGADGGGGGGSGSSSFVAPVMLVAGVISAVLARAQLRAGVAVAVDAIEVRRWRGSTRLQWAEVKAVELRERRPLPGRTQLVIVPVEGAPAWVSGWIYYQAPSTSREHPWWSLRRPIKSTIEYQGERGRICGVVATYLSDLLAARRDPVG